MTAVQLALAVSAAAVAALAIRAHYLGEAGLRQVYLFKPLATLLILALVAVSAPLPPSSYHWAIAAGLLFSTAGDVFLMLPRDRFVAGLASFLVAHLCYLAAFTADAPFGAGLLLWLPFFIAGGAVVMLVWPGLRPALRGPVAAYVLVIAAMAGQATGRWSVGGNEAALLAAVGAGLFVVSDAVLAIDRFRWPFGAARAVTLATYWSAQLLIALSVVP
jgi:uncharacterized membrane protein YhhN